ncbi:MAG: hypothetical protein HUK05_06680 [Prevotella sp.]|nr:hypothetical protein [Prevotella sp.]MCF0208495.1 hypothetical protein [Bacteroidaceae bacterium]
MKKQYITPCSNIHNLILECELCEVSPTNSAEWGNNGQGGSDDGGLNEDNGDNTSPAAPGGTL